MKLHEAQQRHGAQFAPDNIPLRFGALPDEFHAALRGAALMDRSHEGRVELAGEDRFDLLQRISTNDMRHMRPGEGRPTIFTNANARIIDRVVVYNRDDEHLLLITEAGRGQALQQYLQRNIFFNDDAGLRNITSTTHQFALHGPQADAVIEALAPGASSALPFHAIEAAIAGTAAFIARRKPLSGMHWIIIVPAGDAAQLWQTLVAAGKAHGLLPAGSLTYNALRIYAGRPAAGHELSLDYLPLEAGLWDEVSFTKGCYTGQEVIARMESRGRLAKALVRVALSAFVEAPVPLQHDGRAVGTLTSSVTTPDGEHLGLAFVKLALATRGLRLRVGDHAVEAVVTALSGALPPQFVE